MAAVALKDTGLPMTPDGYRYYDMITFGPGSPPPRPHPQPPDPEIPPPVGEGTPARIRPWPADQPAPTPTDDWSPAVVFTAEAPYGMNALLGPYAALSPKKK